MDNRSIGGVCMDLRVIIISLKFRKKLVHASLSLLLNTHKLGCKRATEFGNL